MTLFCPHTWPLYSMVQASFAKWLLENLTLQYKELSLFVRVLNPKAERIPTSICYWNLMEYQIASDTLLSQTKLNHTHTLEMCSSYCSWKVPHALFFRQDSVEHFPKANSPKTTQNPSPLTVQPYHAEEHREVSYTFFGSFTLTIARNQNSL